VQSVSDSSFRISVPPEFAEHLENVEYMQNGDYLITRPADYEIASDPVQVPFPEQLREDVEQDRFDSIVGNILQSLCIASVDKLKVEIPEDIDQNRQDMYEQAWHNQEMFASDHLLWDHRESCMTIKKGLDLDEYIWSVSQYIYRYLVRPLSRGSGFVYTENYDFEPSDYKFGVTSPDLDDEENRIDTRWALAMRSISENFYNLQRQNFAKAMCGMYIGKYLEMCVDIVKRLVESFAALEELFEFDYERLDGIKSGIHSLFEHKSGNTFDERLKIASEKSYSLSASDDDYISRSKEYESDMHFVNDLRNEFYDEFSTDTVDVLRDFEGERVNSDLISTAEEVADRNSKACLLLGQILTFCERLLRFPRSICHVGVGARKVHEVHIE